MKEFQPLGYCRAGLKGGVTETGVVTFACQYIVSPCGRTSNRTVTQIRHPLKRNQNVCDNRLPVHCRRWRLPSCCHTGSHSKSNYPWIAYTQPKPARYRGPMFSSASKSPLRLQSCGAATQWKTGQEKIWKKKEIRPDRKWGKNGRKIWKNFNRANFSFFSAMCSKFSIQANFPRLSQFFSHFWCSVRFHCLLAPHDCNTKERGQEQKKGLLPPPPPYAMPFSK